MDRQQHKPISAAQVAAVVLSVLALILAAGITAMGNDLDLPVKPPVFVGKKGKGNKGPGVYGPPPEEPPGEDPRDTPAPQFWGEVVDEARERIVYVLDRSGSMTAGFGGMVVRRKDSRMVDWAKPGLQDYTKTGWTGSSRWERAQVETIRSIDGLAGNIEFDVLAFSTSTQACFGKAVPATPANKGKARMWILRHVPGGGTCTAPAVVAGLRLLPDACVLLTDGHPECYHPDIIGDHRAAIRAKNQKPTPIRVFGIGVTAKARAFCQGVASDSGGTYTEPSR